MRDARNSLRPCATQAQLSCGRLSSSSKHRSVGESSTGRDSGTTLVWSPLVFLEAPQCWRKLYRKGALPAKPTSANDTIVQADAFADATAQLRRFLGGYETYEVLLTDDVLDLAARQAGQYNLKSHDSVFVAITSTAGVYDVVALDGKFRRVEHVTLWQP